MDVLGRGLAAELGQRLGQNFVVENRAGAGGNLAHEFVAGEKPDGATLLLTSNALVANITLFEGKVRYDPIRSFAPVALVAATPAVIVVRAEGGAADVAALARQARGRGASIGTPGFGNGNHLALVKIQRAQGGDWIHVPYKGAGPAVTGLLGGETDAAIVALPAVASQIQAGKLRALAVLQDQRSAIAPQVPTLTEAGVSIQHDIGWFGLLAPAGTPGATVQRIHRATVDALADERFRAILSKQGLRDPGQHAAGVRRPVAGRRRAVSALAQEHRRQGRVTAASPPPEDAPCHSPRCPRPASITNCSAPRPRRSARPCCCSRPVACARASACGATRTRACRATGRIRRWSWRARAASWPWTSATPACRRRPSPPPTAGTASPPTNWACSIS
jgi:tripartite-type tricarboxylate transporter receptor subunit TctC